MGLRGERLVGWFASIWWTWVAWVHLKDLVQGQEEGQKQAALQVSASVYQCPDCHGGSRSACQVVRGSLVG
jgi:hypothetical protein